jgi:hypothetical protein
MKKIYKLASKLSGYYRKLYLETYPFHNSNMTEQDKAFEIMSEIEEELEKEINKEN